MSSIGHTQYEAMKNSVLLATLVLGTGLGPARAAEPPGADGTSAAIRFAAAARAGRVFLSAGAAFTNNPASATSGWEFARACFDLAEHATNNAQRAALAQQGIAASRAAASVNSNLAAIPYYLGMNLGQLARTKSLGALPLVAEMEDLFRTARDRNETFDHAGPERNLGLLYLEAPGWPVSIGNRAKARQHLRRAVELDPGYPENHLNLLEARLRWGDKDLQPAVEALASLLPAARTRFTGEDWDLAWLDWDRRWKEIQARVARLQKPRSRRTPPASASRTRPPSGHPEQPADPGRE